ncbi:MULTISPECIES: glycosyltransferase family 2 protein [unclassified Rhizobium]|uniref:glycosyltransferase family 2 protein n=1 Tax=unclassified Rhizobium TaxID=2613769 RepID=UPI000EA90BBD|nr:MULTISPECIES: glycosyltransferase family 2 protein [unclassified Rhizobium]AYG68750.1 glycosyltransferase family 2 protein [Rhizobium sp. CCGE531]AYG75136.1 glycosyltransferase family 2 protein [Rhizobium sp. CCGE532]
MTQHIVTSSIRASVAAVPKVSIVVPIFKTEKYLDRCLTSILHQSFSDFEVLCIDDKSPDESWKIVEDFARRDARVRLIRHEQNLGLGGARNTGIRAAKAPYVMGVDSDDYIHPKMVEDLYACAVKTGADVVECGYAEVDEQGAELSIYAPRRDPMEIRDTSNIFSITRFAFWNKLYRRGLFWDENVWFPNKLYYEDLATVPRILARSSLIAYVGDVRYHYVQRSGSITNLINEKSILDYIKILDILLQDLNETGKIELQRQHFRETIKINFDFIKRKIVQSDDLYKMNLLRYASFMEKAYLDFGESDNSILVGIEQRIAALPECDQAPGEAIARVQTSSPERHADIAIISMYGPEETITRLKIGAFKRHLAGRMSFAAFEGPDTKADCILLNHLDSLEGREGEVLAFKKKNLAVPIIALISDFYPRVPIQMRKFYKIVNVFVVPTVEMRDVMACFTQTDVVVMADPIDFCFDRSFVKKHVAKKPLDVMWFGFRESFEKSMREYSPLLEHYHSIRRIRYHIITNTADFSGPSDAILHEYRAESFSKMLPMFDVCVLSHTPNDFQISTYIKSENKAVLAINRGVPVVASKTPSYSRLLGSLNLSNYLYTTRDELEAALFELECPVRRNEYLSQSQKAVLQEFSPQSVAEEWSKLVARYRPPNR